MKDYLISIGISDLTATITTVEQLGAALTASHDECLMILNDSLGTKSGTLYHYTDLSACLSILEKSTLRFTDIRYCNDPEEIEGGLKILNKVHNELLDYYLRENPQFAYTMSFLVHSLNLKTSFSLFDEKLLEKAYSDFAKIGVNPKGFTYIKSNIFISCLSEKIDDLRQWMPYADDGRGVAIGFKGIDGQHFFTTEEAGILAIKVCYKDAAKKEEFVKNIYDRAYKVFQVMDPRLAMVFVNESYGALLGDVVACKSENYKDEEEWRLIKVLKQEEVEKELLFRIKDNIVRPYIDVVIDKDSFLEIVLGPKAEELLNSHALMNASRRYSYPSKIIEKSKIAYR